MKAIFITYNQSLTEEVQTVLDKLTIKGYTQWMDVKGRGSVSGDPHQGTHVWPEMNNAHLAVVEESKVEIVLEKLSALNKEVEEQGLRAFVWNIEGFI